MIYNFNYPPKPPPPPGFPLTDNMLTVFLGGGELIPLSVIEGEGRTEVSPEKCVVFRCEESHMIERQMFSFILFIAAYSLRQILYFYELRVRRRLLCENIFKSII